MRFLLLACASIVAFTSTTAFAAPAKDDDDFYVGDTKFIWRSQFDKPYKSAIEACQKGGALDLKGKTYSGTKKPAKDADRYTTCVFGDFDADSAVAKVELCHDGAEANYKHGGKLMCRYTSADSCEKFKPKGPEPKKDTSERCTQEPNPSAATIQKARQLAADALKAAPQRWLDCYDQAKDLIRAKEQSAPNKGSTGFPDFDGDDLYKAVDPGDPEGPHTVDIGLLCGSRDGDFAAANNIAGFAKTPVRKELQEGKEVEVKYTWHHHEDLGKMVLVRTISHQPSKVDGIPGHTGGVAIWKKYLGGY